MVYNSVASGSYTSMLKFTIDGRPTVEDIHDLFSSMVSRIQFSVHKHMFRSHGCSFLSDDAINQLTSPPLSQPNMYNYDSESPKTLKLNRDMAKALVQQFLWTRLIENACEPQNKSYKDKGIWKLTSKGHCIFQDYLIRTKTDMTKFSGLVDASAKPMFLIQIERTKEDDRISCDTSHISSLFAIMISSLPLRVNNQNDVKIPTSYHDLEDSYSVSSSDSNSTFSSSNYIRGLSFSDYFPHVNILPNDSFIGVNAKAPHQFNFKSTFHQQQALLQNLNPSPSNKFKMRAMFSSILFCNWLIEYCTVASNDEAESIMTKFLNLGWIEFYDEKYKHCYHIEASKSTALLVTKVGMKVVIDISLEKYNQVKQQQQKQQQQTLSSFQHIENRLSIEILEKRNSFASSLASIGFSETVNATLQSPASEDKSNYPKLRSKPSFYPLQTKSLANISTSANSSAVSTPLFEISSQGFGGSYFDLSAAASPTTPMSDNGSMKESNTLKLKTILKNEELQQLFRDFLSANFCVKNLDFWIDHDKLLRSYHRQKASGMLNQRQVLEDAYILWDFYLRPGTLRELNVDHALCEEMAEDFARIVTLVQTPTTGQTRSLMVVTSQSTTHSLIVILNWLDKVNDYVCRVMAADSLPQFIRTSEYRSATSKFCLKEEDIQRNQNDLLYRKIPVKTSILTNDLDDFPPPPQRQLKETLYL